MACQPARHRDEGAAAWQADGHTVPDWAILIDALGLPLCVPYDSIVFTRSRPSMTSPKTTCLPSSQPVLTVVMKNCEPLVLGPALAMDSRPGLVCLCVKFSSANFSP